ncbi:hypothetical protein H6F95_30865 [Cyanobacteria bacterium FACHB-471]|nr:hypothetical protein [Cyanobacteria bacterium FACHB-471]
MFNLTIQYHWLGMAIATILISTALTQPSFASPDLTQINAALNYPTAAERFFNEGQQQFEQEVQRLSEPSNTTEALQIDGNLPDTSEQQRLQLEQPEGRSQDRKPASPSDAL